MTLQPFINYNMKDGWYLVTASVMTANWEADSGDQWTVPLGGGVGRVFKIGKPHVNVRLAGYYNVEAADVTTMSSTCNSCGPSCFLKGSRIAVTASLQSFMM
jgi:hypothetical protein